MGKLSKNIDLLRDEVNLFLPNTCSLNSQNVLVIDDEVHNLKAFKSLFRRYLNVYTASNLKESLDVIRSNKIDVIFCDYSMPVNTGAYILEEIVKEFPNVKRVVVTGYNTRKHREELMRSNTYTIIDKPYTFDQIIGSISSYVA